VVIEVQLLQVADVSLHVLGGIAGRKEDDLRIVKVELMQNAAKGP